MVGRARILEAAYARGQHPASAREGSLRKAELIDPEGASSMAPALPDLGPGDRSLRRGHRSL